MRLLTLLLAATFWLGGCALNPDPTKDWSAQRFYHEAKSAMDNSDWATAIKHFETLEARYPYGAYAEQAQLEVAYAYYKNDEALLAVDALERFLRLHPTHRHVDYAYYLKGLAHSDDNKGLIERLVRGKSDKYDRDPKAARDAYEAFRQVVTRFPESRYAEASAARMNELIDGLARYEVSVADYYLRRSAYVAAVNRTKHVIENYQRTPAIEDALGVQAKAYKLMGLNDLLTDTLRVLRMNYPNSRYLGEIEALKTPAAG